MNSKKQKILQIGAIISTILAVTSVFLMIFVNDKFTNLTILFAVLSTIFATNANNKNLKKKELTEKEKLIRNFFLWISIILIIIGIIFAFIYA